MIKTSLVGVQGCPVQRGRAMYNEGDGLVDVVVLVSGTRNSSIYT